MKYKRIFTIVLDSLGIGEMKDSASFGDIGVDTFGHIAEKNPNMVIPNLKKLGIGNLKKMTGIDPVEKPMARFMRLNEESNGKDTMTGHWEMMGLKTTKPFITFTDTGFPPELIEELEKKTGHKVIGNKASSGTVILDELGEEHIKTGAMIVYTSADSVLQIAAHEKYFGLDELYRCCDIAREITMKPEWNVGRIIARPFIGEKKEEFARTPNRHDIAVKPFGKTALNTLKDNGFDMISIGKINDIFVGEGVTEAIKSQSSVNGMEQTVEVAKDRDFTGLCFVNLVDFDAKWGHRRDPKGYAHEIEMFDEKLGELLKYIKDDDLIILTADHGNDPTYTGSDHTREQVPFIAYSPSMQCGKDLGEADTFAIIGATIVDNFGLKMPEGTIGTSYLAKLID